MKYIVALFALVVCAFVYVPLGWAILVWMYTTITKFWGLA